MAVSGIISISGQRLDVSSLITESFVVRTSDRSTHAVSVNMTNLGNVSVMVDGKEETSYHKEIRKSGIIDKFVGRLHSKLAKGYKAINDYYLYPYKANSPVCSEKEVKEQINKLRCEDYQPKAFELERPGISEVEIDLKEEAKNQGYEKSLDIEKYVADKIEDSFNYRLLKWESIRKFHFELEAIIAEEKNKAFLSEYEKEKKNLYDIIEGKEDFVEEQIKKVHPRNDVMWSWYIKK